MKPQNLRSLTSLRGVAAWWVVLYHFQDSFSNHTPQYFTNLIDQGYLAVDFFFILSGFVIQLNYGKYFRQDLKTNYIDFCLKRIARIYPLHLFILFLFIANFLAIYFFSSSKDLHSRYDALYFIYSIFLVQNWGFSSNLQWNIPSWSISTEFGAYLMFPVISYYLSKIRIIKTMHFFALVAIALLGLAYFYYANKYLSLGDDIPKTGLFRCIVEFLVGILAAKHFEKNGMPIFHSHLVFLFGVLTLFLGNLYDFKNYTYIPASFFFFILAFTNSDFIFSKLLKGRIMHYLGEISYSTYLIHYFAKDWVKFLSKDLNLYSLTYYIAGIFIASICLHRFLEKPAQHIFYQKFKYGFKRS